MRSMTGFGIGEVQAGPAGKLTVEIRAVNHRFLDVRVRAPSQLPDLAASVETIARERLTRGRFDVTVRLEGGSASAVSLDKERARAVFTALSALRDELAPGVDVPLSLLAAVPDLFVPALAQDHEALLVSVTVAFDRALAALDAMRLREGVALEDDLTRRLATIRTLAGGIEGRSPRVVEHYLQRLTERASLLRAASDVAFDRGRLEQELALFADRIDVCEELTRLESHVSHCLVVMGKSEGIGRRLDFLLQEMAREANTIGAKSQDAEIAHTVVELKAEIERMREQVQNIE